MWANQKRLEKSLAKDQDFALLEKQTSGLFMPRCSSLSFTFSVVLLNLPYFTGQPDKTII